jgi:ubiquinone/menaquinone biosynthesis C-methylase UbiE
MSGFANGFDRLAKPYRWMEYLTFGPALERCRFRFLPQLTNVERALVLGDGDGRFTAQLLRTAAAVRVEAVDGSSAMLAELRARCAAAGVADRVGTFEADLSKGLPAPLKKETFDLVTTHFFLDCLTTAQTELLVAETAPLLRTGGCWIVSEFAVPNRGAMQWPAALVVRALYLGFRLLTGLRTQQLPDYRTVLQHNGLILREETAALGGLLISELWVGLNSVSP